MRCNLDRSLGLHGKTNVINTEDVLPSEIVLYSNIFEVIFEIQVQLLSRSKRRTHIYYRLHYTYFEITNEIFSILLFFYKYN